MRLRNPAHALYKSLPRKQPNPSLKPLARRTAGVSNSLLERVNEFVNCFKQR